MAKHKSGTSDGSLRSLTAYVFDLDDRQLSIRDLDYFVPIRDVALSDRTRLKVVSRYSSDMIAELRWPEQSAGQSSDPEEALKRSKPVPDSIAEIKHESNALVLKLHRPLNISPELPVLLYLQYNVSLNGDGANLFFCGSIQPSDYHNFKDYLNLTEVKKTIRLVVYSSKEFDAWVFDASNPVSFPIKQGSARKQVQRFDLDIPLTFDLREWDRASYFGIFCRPAS